VEAATIDGRLAPRLRSRVLRLLMGLTGLLLARALVVFVASYLLGYRRPCTARIHDEGIVIESSTCLLGRIVRTVATRIPPWKIDRVDREDRFRHAHVLVGALFFLLGVAGGFGLVVEWAWTRFGLYLLLGLGAIALGIAIDLAVVALVPAARGRSTIVIWGGGSIFRIEDVVDGTVDGFTRGFEELSRVRGGSPAGSSATRRELPPRDTPT